MQFDMTEFHESKISQIDFRYAFVVNYEINNRIQLQKDVN